MHSDRLRSCLKLMFLFSFRVRKNGSKIYKLGCTRPTQTCEEEDRNRKKKTCCRDWFCNRRVPSHWLADDDAAPVTTPTPVVNTSTVPDPLNLSTDSPIIEEESSNCTVKQDDSLMLTPCVGPGSVNEPPILRPIDTTIIPFSEGPTGYPSGMNMSTITLCVSGQE